ncbi:response regulator [Nocardioides caldifontis]|uniref:response regulator n=1 Tax=Nocardioides caldifontis TaxID=2588938 RepID=UPI001396C817|nr:response regulator [Nocardioides caldifontis]
MDRTEPVRTVVVVEDDPDLQLLTTLMLTRAGYAVRSYGDAREALPACTATPPDVVVLDWMLPGMSGIEALAALRAHPATADVPVVMATALGLGENVEQAVRGGAQGYLVKPFAQAELVRTLDEVLADHARQRRQLRVPAEVA